MHNKIDLLAHVQFFALLDEQERTDLAEHVGVRAAKAGQAVFNMGDPGDELFIVSAGRVEISFKSHTGDKITLETCGQGDVFGELSLLDGGARTASATTTQDSELLVVSRSALHEFLRLKPEAAMGMLEAMGRRLRETSRLLRATAIRNANQATQDDRSAVERGVDWVAFHSGSLSFLFIHVAVFTAWIVLNAGPLAGTKLGGFDRYPFGLLTMCVSLEAIMLSVLVLLSQNRSAARDKVRNDIEYDTNLRAELEVNALHEKVDDLRSEVLSRLQRLERD